MLKPHDFDTVQANSNYTPLEKGGYICRIMGVEETATRDGAPMLSVSLDIAEGPESGRFAKEYRDDTRNPKKWGCIYRQNITTRDGGTSPFFKGLITAIEESNGMTVNWTDNPQAFAEQFKNRLVGVVFGREQYKKQDGTLAWTTRPTLCITVQKLRAGDFTVPEDKEYKETVGASNAPGAYSAPGYSAPQFENMAVNRYVNGTAEPPVSVPQTSAYSQQLDLPF